MMNQYTTLPDLYITGGTSDEIVFHMLSSSSVPIDLNECDINFSVSNIFSGGVPIINYSSTDAGSGNISISINSITVNMSPVDTKNMSGKYTYQITIRDGLDNYVSYQGSMFIKRNINPDFIDSEV